MKGQSKKALEYYLQCKEHAFARSRIEVLSPLTLVPVSSPSSRASALPPALRLKNLIDRQAYIVLQAVKNLLVQHKKITQQKLIAEAKLTKKQVVRAIKSLQAKGYLYKVETQYSGMRIRNEPIEYQGAIGIPQQEEEVLPSSPPKRLVFSLQTKQLYVQSSTQEQQLITQNFMSSNPSTNSPR